MFTKTLLIIATAFAALTVSAEKYDPNNDPNLQQRLESLLPQPETPSFPSEPARGTYQCYVRSSTGKLYGPGAESRSQASARSAALSRCGKMTKSKCTIAYCDSL